MRKDIEDLVQLTMFVNDKRTREHQSVLTIGCDVTAQPVYLCDLDQTKSQTADALHNKQGPVHNTLVLGRVGISLNFKPVRDVVAEG